MLIWFSKFLSLVLSGQSLMAQSFMPTQGSEIAKRVDSLYSFLLIISLIACIIVIGGMIYFVLKYKRKSDNDKTAYITHDTRLEILWSVIPLVIFLFVFAWGWIIYHENNAKKCIRNSSDGSAMELDD
jgi:cytochrome c oxidase subunit II